MEGRAFRAGLGPQLSRSLSATAGGNFGAAPRGIYDGGGAADKYAKDRNAAFNNRA
jgi:hypothetical protein